MLNKVKNMAVVMLILISASILLDTSAYAVRTRKTPAQVTQNGIRFLRFNHTFAATADTIVFPFTITRVPGAVSTPVTINVYSGAADADEDSITISVRLLVTSNPAGTSTAAGINLLNYKSFTLGTDSTTFETPLIAANGTYKLNVFPLAVATYGGWYPYYEIHVFRKSTYNKAGVKVIVDVIEQ